jgi:hypothetical protein
MRKLYRNRFVHNVIGHPLMEIFHLCGLERLSEFVHEVTLPSTWKDWKGL